MNLIILNNIEIQVIKKKIKNLHLSVIPPNGQVKISAPLEIWNSINFPNSSKLIPSLVNGVTMAVPQPLKIIFFI